MWKHPPDVNASETCIDANQKMVERRTQTTFPISCRGKDAHGRYPKLPLTEPKLLKPKCVDKMKMKVIVSCTELKLLKPNNVDSVDIKKIMVIVS